MDTSTDTSSYSTIKPVEIVYFICDKIKTNMDDRILLLNYNNNKIYILYLHLLKQMLFVMSSI